MGSSDERVWDVVVIGGGNAGVVSALTASDHGASVLIVERATRAMRGGNSRHTRNIRCVHDGRHPWTTGAYRYDELWTDLCGVGTGPSDEQLAALTVRSSEHVPDWMIEHGARFQPSLRGTLHLGRTNQFFLGGGKALLNTYYRRAEEVGIPVLYETSVTELVFDGDRCTELVVERGDSSYRIRAKAVVCAAGGFEANIEWLTELWGDAAANYHVRGTPHNDGTVLRCLLGAGAASAGDPRGFHCVAVDARSPRFDGGIATRVDSIPFGVVVNRSGERFYDEGEDVWPKRYAIWGRNIAQQPGQIAFALWDSKVNDRFLPPMYGAISGDSVASVAQQFGLDPVRVAATVARFNAGAPHSTAGGFDPGVLDGLATVGLDVAKSNWAQRLDTPPYYGIALRPGITFTYLGVQVDRNALVQRQDQSRFANVFAAGEIMSGNILSTGYMAGFGMTIGTVWGRIAGEGAAGRVDR